MSKQMARRLSSPTANLLRKSRLFSLPPPIPAPFEGDGAFESSVGSDTATQAFPTYQAIATPTSSLHRGDWGLKRPLPMRETTRSSAPAMRVFEVDTINFITDFESAGDHVRTLEKWQEMNMPLSLSGRKHPGASFKDKFVSVFTDREDNTHLSKEKRDEGYRKWKHDGPWVGDMTAGEFVKFLNTKVHGAKESFGAFLKKKVTEAAIDERREAARNEGTDLPKDGHFELSPQEYQARVKRLREDTSLSSPLAQWIIQYFDMPDLREGVQIKMGDDTTVVSLSDEMMSKPRTHPSAGLSYLRSRNFLDNHPILGPRDDHAPLEARLLSSSISNNKNTKVGVAGVVADLSRHMNAASRESKYKFEEKGGHKLWVTPSHATVDSEGRILLETVLETEYSVASWKGKSFSDLNDIPTVGRADPMPSAAATSMPNFSNTNSPDENRSRTQEDVLEVVP